MTGAQIASAARNQLTVIPRLSAGEAATGYGFIFLMLAAVLIAFVGLAAIIWDFASDGVPVLSWDFITSFPSRVIPENSGIQSAIVGTIWNSLAPVPITATRAPVRSVPSTHAAECIATPSNRSAPGMSGMRGRLS